MSIEQVYLDKAIARNSLIYEPLTFKMNSTFRVEYIFRLLAILFSDWPNYKSLLPV
jgi:hypothetical protein